MSQRVKKKASPMARQEAVAGYVFILPTILLYLCLTIIPIIVTFSLSFMDYDLVKPSTFIGFDNYIKLVSGQPAGAGGPEYRFICPDVCSGQCGDRPSAGRDPEPEMPKFFVNFFRFSVFSAGSHRLRVCFYRMEQPLLHRYGRVQLFLKSIRPGKGGLAYQQEHRAVFDYPNGYLEKRGLFYGDFPGGPAKHPRSVLRGRPNRRRQPVPAVPPYYASASEPHHVFQCDLVLDQCFAGVRRRVYLDPRRPGRRFQKHCGIYL